MMRCGKNGRFSPLVNQPNRAKIPPMRPTLNVLSNNLIQQILHEAKRILAEVGIEVRGPELR